MRTKNVKFAKFMMALVILSIPLSVYSDETSSSPETREYLIRTAMLKQLALLVKWPFEITTKNICIYDPHKKFYEANISYKYKTGAKDAKILYLNGYTESETHTCNIIYFDSDEITRLKGVLAFAKEQRIFIVGLSSDFLYVGGMASLVENNGTIQIELNLSSIKDAGLDVSPSLIEVSRRVLN